MQNALAMGSWFKRHQSWLIVGFEHSTTPDQVFPTVHGPSTCDLIGKTLCFRISTATACASYLHGCSCFPDDHLGSTEVVC